MQGKVVKYFEDKGFGFIGGEDNESYFFHVSELTDGPNISIGDEVNFAPSENEKGKNATQVTVQG